MKKRILVKQRDLSDCGAACLASVAAYFGLQIPVSRIRRYAGTDKQGTSLYGLIEAAGNLNFQARGAKATGIAPEAIPAPSIFHLVTENGIQHFVVVYKINSKRVSYMDPAWGRLITCPFPVFKKSWTGVVLLLMPSAQFQRGNEKKQIILRFWQLILPHRSMLLHAIVGAVVYTILGLSTSIYVEKIIDFVIPDGNKQLVNVLSILMIVLLVFRLIMGYFKSVLLLRTGQQIDSWLIMGYYKHLLALPQRFFDSMRIGEIISRVNDAVRIRLFINDVAQNIVLQTLTMVLALTVMFVYNWKLAIVLVASLPFYLLIYGISNKVNAKWQREIMEKGAVLESQLVETIQGVRTIRRFGSEAWFILKTEHRFISMMRTLFTSSRNGLLIAHATEGIGSLLTICILWTGSFLVIDRFLSAGELLSFYTLAAFFTNPVLSLIGANGAMQDALIAADRLFEIIDLETEMDIIPVKGLERLPAGDLIFKNAYFSYGCGNSVFSGLHLEIPRNQITAILGESGCGKSTLLSLIQRLYPLNAGNIMIGETDIRDIAIKVLRDKMAAVPQHTDLFQMDIISNITLGDPTPDLERIFNICHRLGLHEFISQLPARYQTIIREQGINLSVGQKQRIGIARALYKDPSILILDEATSALDPETERKVQETIRWFSRQERTVVIISHRLATIKYCEFIIFLKQGADACSGTHQWLLSENRDYARWWEQHY